MQKYNNRKDVPDKYKWNLADFYKSEADFNKAIKKCQKSIVELAKYKGCTKHPKQLYEFLEKQTECIALWQNLYVYSYLINDQELGQKESIERKNTTEQLKLELENHINFFAPELLNLSDKEYESLFIKEEKLNEYRSYLDRIYREKAHILTESEEIIISKLTNSMNHFNDLSSLLTNQLHDYGTVTINKEKIAIAPNNYNHLMKNKSDKIRKEVRDKFNKVLSSYAPSNALCLSSYISMNDTIAQIRHFSSSWEAKLFSTNLTEDIFKTLVNTVENNLKSLQKYYDLKKKTLNLKKLTSYDLTLELAPYDKEYTIEEGQKLVLNAIKPLGETYYKKFKKIIDCHYIDYCQYKGKRNGGYSFSTIDKPSRILMNYNGDLSSVSTIAHEGGHNVHHQFITENNPRQYRNQSSIVCEVASLTNECLLSSYLAEHGKTKEEKMAGIANILNVIVSNLFGAVREGKMEEEMYQHVHEGLPLTKEYLDDLSYNSLSKYYGKSVKYDQKIKNSWITRNHYYMHFYLYSYAISISVACSVAKKILANDSEMLNKYLQFLKVGSDKWPTEIYEILGIDLKEKNVYQDAIEYFDSMINKFIEISEE